MRAQTLQQYSMMVKFLCHMLGPNYEIVLYDCCGEQPSVAAAANGHITGRALGAGLTHALREIMGKELWKTQDWQQHFCEISDSGTVLRSSVLFLKDEEGELEGLFCISFDDRRYRELTEKLFELCQPSEFSVLDLSIGDAGTADPAPTSQEPGQTVVSSSLRAAIDAAMDAVLNREMTEPVKLKQEERMKIIRFLNQREFFSRKGAISMAAERLGCSKSSIYRYLSNLD